MQLNSIMVDNFKYVQSPEVRRSHHHNHIQNGEPASYEKLTAKDKRVLTYLRKLGLYRIIFSNFAPDTTYEYGAVKIIGVEETEDSDIVEGWFYGCLDFRILVKLYFPKRIGGLLHRYSKGELLQKNMNELITTLGL